MSELEAVARFMERHGLLLVTAESCTAGLIAAHLADVPGAGSLLDCAFVVYSPEAKKRCLNVSEHTLRTHNLTSEAVAREMALGALAGSGRANLAVSNTGLADDSDQDLPAGTQCFAWAFRSAKPVQPAGLGPTLGAGAVDESNDSPMPDESVVLFSETRCFEGDRVQIRAAGAFYALLAIPSYFKKL